MAELSLPPFDDAGTSAPDELIVATEHLGFVREWVAAPHIVAESSNRPLGLTRLQFVADQAVEDLEKAVEKDQTATRVRETMAKQAAVLTTVRDDDARRRDPIATIATDLRALAVAHHGGWMPTIGRNRLVGYPGSDPRAATREISFGQVGASREISFGQRKVGAAREISFGRRVGATSQREISFGGGGVPRPLVGRKWTTPAPRGAGPGAGVRIGVLDTAIWPHPWLAGAWTARPSDVLPEGYVFDHITGHATFVAGLILSQAPGAALEVRCVLDDEGQGTAWDVAEAIVEVGRSGVDVLNLSLSSFTGDGLPPLALARAIDRVNADVVVVAAAGNHAIGAAVEDDEPAPDRQAFAALPSWPGALDDVVAVGALGRDGRSAPFSPVRPWVDVAARGVALRSTYLPVAGPEVSPMSYGPGWAEWSGTSFSAALVTGAIGAGVDPGRFSAPEALEDLLTTGHPQKTPSEPRRVRVRTTGWARRPRP